MRKSKDQRRNNEKCHTKPSEITNFDCRKEIFAVKQKTKAEKKTITQKNVNFKSKMHVQLCMCLSDTKSLQMRAHLLLK